MSTLTTYYGLVEQAKRLDPDGKLSTIVEVLNREMGNILAEAPWLPSNDTGQTKPFAGSCRVPHGASWTGVAKQFASDRSYGCYRDARSLCRYDKTIDAFRAGRARLINRRFWKVWDGFGFGYSLLQFLCRLMVCTALLASGHR